MKVTIGIPVFNCETWVATAIQSALNQTWPDKEIIVVDDDGSTARSLQQAKRRLARRNSLQGLAIQYVER